MSGAAVRRVWVTGARGQLGTELVRTAPAGVELIASDHASVDIGDRARVLAFAGERQPALIINAAAYTAVDKAESEADLAFRINRVGAAHLAEAAVTCGAQIIQVSTDYVFDGRQSTPYQPDDTPNPLNVYGESKLGGERAVREVCGEDALIVRTAWVYSAHGNNFVKTMLRLLRERKEVRVVCDQIGTPTHAKGLAEALWRFSDRAGLNGTFHWTDAGVASWYDFAECVRAIGSRIAPGAWARIVPIAAVEYPTPARRPAFGVLDKSSAWKEIGCGRNWPEMVELAVGAALASTRTGNPSL